MAATGRPTTDWGRLLRLAAAVALASVGALVVPDLARSAWSYVKVRLPLGVGRLFEDSRWLWAGVAAAAPLQWAFRRRRATGRDEAAWDRFARRFLVVALPIALAGPTALMFLTWLPHRLHWPCWADVEHFALSALSWEAGLVPYRDLYDFNFPGPMYLHWGLGKVFGWGRTIPFYVLDTLIFVGFAATVLWWSRRRLGGPVPGLLAIVTLTQYQCSLPYWLTAQRDWHVPLLACAGLMILEARPGRAGRLAAAGLAVAAFSFRPHVVVFGPAYLAALDENARPTGGPPGRTLRAVLEWTAVASLGGVLVFAPLMATGVLDDFRLNFREALDGGYEEAGRRPFGADLVRQFTPWRTVGVDLGVAAMALGAASPGPRRLARTWLLALVFVLLYLPLSPVAHAYLDHPLKVVWCVGLGVVAAGLLEAEGLAPSAKVALTAALAVQAVPGLPYNCRPSRTADSALRLVRGESTELAPPGCEREFSRMPSHPARWGDYHAALAYLREQTGPRTPVANFVRSYPYPTFNAPAGRLTPFPSVAGILWLRWVDPGLEPEFARALERPGDGVVVWMPGVPVDHDRLKLPVIEATIRRCYAPEAHFGKFEIWRRRPDVPPSAPAPAGTSAPTAPPRREDP